MKRVLVLSFTAALVSISAFAVDGTVLINQSTVTSTGGFPYKITQPGSYKLSGNLVAAAGTHGILIQADDVTVDLNGFSITGPGVFPNSIGSLPASGIFGSDHQRIRIFGGNVSGFVTGLYFGGSARDITLDKLVVSAQLLLGTSTIFGSTIKVGEQAVAASLITNVVASEGFINVTCPSLLVNVVTQLVRETRIPASSGTNSFPTNCTGSGVVIVP